MTLILKNLCNNNGEMSTIFEKIARKELPASILLEDDEFMAFKDINPQAETHLLVIPKTNYRDFSDFMNKDGDTNKIFKFVYKVIKHMNLQSYKIITNTGAEAGQTVFHWHIHLLSGPLKKGYVI